MRAVPWRCTRENVSYIQIIPGLEGVKRGKWEREKVRVGEAGWSFRFKAGAGALQVVAAPGPVFALFTDRDLVGFAEPGAVVLDPVKDVGRAGVGLQAAAFTPFVDLDLVDLDLHEIVLHSANSTHKNEPFQDDNNI